VREMTKQKVKCPDCGKEFEAEFKFELITYSGAGDMPFGNSVVTFSHLPSLPENYTGDMPHTIPCKKCGRKFWTGYHKSTPGICHECNPDHNDEWLSLRDRYETHSSG